MNPADWKAGIESVRAALRSDWRWAARFAALAAVFLVLLVPLQARLSAASKTLEQRQKEIDAAKQASLNVLSAAELQKMQARAAAFESGYILLAQVGSVLNRISDEAQARQMRVIRIHSESPVAIPGAEVLVKGKKLSRLPIRVRLETNFRKLGEFLKALSKDSKLMFVVDEMALERAPGAGENNLRCDLTLAYFSV